MQKVLQKRGIMNYESSVTNHPTHFYHFRLIFNKKFGQEFVHFSSAWSSKMNDKTKLKDLKFKNEILFESKMRGKNKIKG
jgi:hypothetical protein